MLNSRKRPLGPWLLRIALCLLVGGRYILKSPAHEILLWTGLVALVAYVALLIAARLNGGGPATPGPLNTQRP